MKANDYVRFVDGTAMANSVGIVIHLFVKNLRVRVIHSTSQRVQVGDRISVLREDLEVLDPVVGRMIDSNRVRLEDLLDD